jgi:1-acyl-sn-glycerol-3-phosphate acyltransferase
MLLPVSLVAAPLIILLPRLRWRRMAARAAVRAFLALSGVRLRVTGLELLPPGAAVLVANHASYLDGPVLFAALPPRFGFVIKKEVSRIPVAGWVLRRLDHEFVDRFNRHAGAIDVRRILRVVASGQSLVFFPEGTITCRAALGRFHTGAFVTACRAGVPVVTAAIRGSRRVLPATRTFPRGGPIDVEILRTLQSAVDPEHAAAELRDEARRTILGALDEPGIEHLVQDTGRHT